MLQSICSEILTAVYIYTGHRGKFMAIIDQPPILVGMIFERIRSVRARTVIDVSIDILSMYENLFISTFNKITLITFFISYIVHIHMCRN